jgi:flavin-dependent dehydrogenase
MIELLYGGNGEVVGNATRGMGIARDGRLKAGSKGGMEPIRQIVLLAEGVHSSLSRQAVSRYRLDSASGPLHLNYKTRHFPHSISFSLSRPICWCVGPLLVPNG